MTTYHFEVPADSDLWPCPGACGGFTDDPYGGPCTDCWNRIGDSECDGIVGPDGEP